MNDFKMMSDFSICNVVPNFKGWTKPGPFPDLEAAKSIPILHDESVDALSGHFRIVQLKKGHRFSTDDILTAWYATLCAPSPNTVLDLGSGVGSVAMVMAWRLQGGKFTTIEAQERSVALAEKSMRYNGLQTRFDIRHGDFRDPVLESEESFDLITGSPPYWPESDGIVSMHEQKRACRFEIRGDLRAYLQIAEAHLKPGGIFVFVFPTTPSHQLTRVFDAIETSSLRLLRWRNVVLQEGRGHDIGLFTCIQKTEIPSDLVTWKEHDLIIRDIDGNISLEYQHIKMSFGFPPTQ